MGRVADAGSAVVGSYRKTTMYRNILSGIAWAAWMLAALAISSTPAALVVFAFMVGAAVVGARKDSDDLKPHSANCSVSNQKVTHICATDARNTSNFTRGLLGGKMLRFTYQRYHIPTNTQSTSTLDAPCLAEALKIVNSWNGVMPHTWTYWIALADTPGMYIPEIPSSSLHDLVEL